MYRLIIKHKESLIKESLSIWDVSSLASQIEHYTSIDSQPGKLSFILEKDPVESNQKGLQLSEGDEVEFSVSDESGTLRGIFKGYIFTLGTDSTEAYKVTAYDQTRYLKNKDVLYVENITLSDLFEKICKTNAIQKYKINVVSTFVLKPKLYNNVSYYEMLDDAIQQTLVGSPKHPLFFIRDNFGVLELDELMTKRTPYVIGDDSLLTDYQYEVDIDKETYNRVMVVETANKELKGQPNIHFMQDVANIMKMGVLQKVIPVQSGTDIITVENLAKLTLELYNKPKTTVNLNALGVLGLNAGYGFVLRLKKLNITGYYMYITSAIHYFDSDYHTMELEVSGVASLADLPEKPSNVLIDEILNGEWGSGEIRKNNITEAGYDYNGIQSEINELFDVAQDTLTNAKDIQYIDGEYVIGEETTKILQDSGFDISIMKKIMKIIGSK